MEEYQNQRIIHRLFMSLLPVQALAVGLPAINTLLNSIIVGNCFGSSALAAIGFVSPLNNLLSAFSSVLATGSQLLCGRGLGKGDRKEMSVVFSTTLVLSVILGVLFSAVTLLFPEKLAALLGAGSESLQYTAAYIRGIGVGPVFTILLACVLPFLQLEHQGSVSTVVVIVLVVSNVAGNLMNAFVFNGGLLGVGFSTSIANMLSATVALAFLLVKGKLFRFTPALPNPKVVKQIIQNGLPNALSPGLEMIRSYIINKFAFLLGGTIGMSAMSIACNISVVLGGLVEAGYSGSCRMIASILVGQRDCASLRDLPKIMVRSTWFLYVIAYAVAFFFAKPLSLLFGADPEHIAVYVMVVRVLNLWCLTNIFKAPPLCIYQAMNRMKEVTVAMIINLAIVPVVTCYLFGERLGLPVVASLSWTGEIAIMIYYAIVFTIKAGRLPRSLVELCYIPDTGGNAENRFNAVVHTAEDVTAASQQAIEFCQGRGLDAQKAYYCGLAIEEMAIFTVTYGFEKQDATIDLRIIYEDGTISIMLRDDSRKFDPIKWLELCSPEDRSRSFGIRMIKDLASEMNYTNTLGLNVLMIRI